MSQQAQIVAFDGASTPVSHTLVPVGVKPNGDVFEAFWREMGLTIPAYCQVSFALTRRLLKSGIERVSFETRVPVQETVGSQNAAGYTAAPAVAFVDTAQSVFFFAPRSTSANRRLLRQLHVNALGGVVTSVAPVTTHDAAQLIDLGVFPS